MGSGLQEPEKTGSGKSQIRRKKESCLKKGGHFKRMSEDGIWGEGDEEVFVGKEEKVEIGVRGRGRSERWEKGRNRLGE
jgi:hypothetical protein